MEQFSKLVAIPARRVYTPARLALLAGCYLLVFASLAGLLLSAHETLLQEVRAKARGLASIVAMHVDADELEAIRTPDDMARPEFHHLVEYFNKAKSAHEDIAFVYAIRPQTGEAGASHWEFILDAQPEDVDRNGDGRISPEEEGVKPGTDLMRPPSAAMFAAMRGPAAEPRYYVDRWGTFITGYAPVKDPATGQTVGLLAIDVTKQSIAGKAALVNVAASVAAVVLLVLVTLALGAFFQKTETLEVVRAMDRTIREQNKRLEQTVRQLQDREAIMQQDLELARELQTRFMPASFPFPESLRCAGRYRACSIVGGDLYDLFRLGDQLVGFYMADVSGHGVSAALVTAILKASVDRSRRVLGETFASTDVEAHGSAAVSSLMAQLNATVNGAVREGSFATILFGVLDLRTGNLWLGNAGHNLPLVVGVDGSVRTIEAPPNLPLGLMPIIFEVARSAVEPGEKLVVYTDGLPERRNSAGEEFGEERLARTLAAHGTEAPEEIVRALWQSLDEFGGPHPPDDDQAILVLERRLSKPPSPPGHES